MGLCRATACFGAAGEGDRRAFVNAARGVRAAGEAGAVLPQGGILLDRHPPVPLRRGVVLLSRMTGAPIVPVRIGGVRGAGLTVAAVFMRSKARLEMSPALHCKSRAVESCLDQLSRALGPPEHMRDKG